ncbi:RagB/SusD family nutrient uptake outer membrane protein [Flectobacillus major]|uniref:RagB/SusD family nutrient uptake outer membrane protein n=1 Tax=Flectobacillus major TaxID=103 RepID=UPI0005C4A7FC|nr:RagB/SusD family nutrient uptake outer membrane protein [Flectobacillus major]
MKINIIGKTLVSASLLTALTVVGCKDSFLEVAPNGQLTSVLLTSKAGLEGTLMGAYSMLNGRGFTRLASSTNWVYGSILGGEANKGTESGDYGAINPIQRFETIASAGDVEGTWNGKYEGISRANAVIRLVTQADASVTAADKARILAEAKFLRAHYYFELKRLFNYAPYIDETVDYGTGIEKVKNDTDLWPKIEADLKAAMDALPEVQIAAGRANKWAAAAYLAKTYLYQKKYAEAKALFDQVIANGKTANGKKYGLVAKYAEVFNAANDNNEESVFAIQAAANTGSVNNANPEFDLNFPYGGAAAPGGCCGFFQPSFELVNSFRTDANGLPLLDGSYNTGNNVVKNDFGLLSKDAFTPDAGNLDPRLDHSVGRRGIPYLDYGPFPGNDWIRSQSYAGPYSTKKFVYYKSQEGTLTDGSSWTRGYAAMNYNVIRYADVLLMAAEAEIEVGSLTKALEYINAVRNRAANQDGWVKLDGKPAAKYVISPYSAFADKDAARKALRFERKLELSGEGHRFFDLVRWGVAEKEINAYLSYEGRLLTIALGGAKFTPGKSEYLPIPQTQIDRQGKDVLKQNPGY